MKKLSQISCLFVGLMFVFIGCDAAQNAANDAQNAVGDMADKAGDMADKAADMANIDFGDFDMDGMKEKLSGITDGFKDVTADNVDGLTSKISDLGGSLEGMGIDSLPGPAKTAVGGVMSTFVTTIKTAMEGISDEGILGKLKPVVETLITKMEAFQ